MLATTYNTVYRIRPQNCARHNPLADVDTGIFALNGENPPEMIITQFANFLARGR
jgi:hypothetical protein